MKQEYTVQNPLGIHVKPAKLIVQTAEKYACSIYLEKNGKRVNARKMIDILTLGAKKGDVIALITEGDGQEEAQREIGSLLTRGIDATKGS